MVLIRACLYLTYSNIYGIDIFIYINLPFSLDSIDSFKFPETKDIFKTGSDPNEFSLFAKKAVDEEDDGIMREDEVDFDSGAYELLTDNDDRDSLVCELTIKDNITSTRVFNFHN